MSKILHTMNTFTLEGSVALKGILLANYGCNLDHYNIHYLVKDRLSKFEVEWGDIPENKNEEGNILFQMDVYDINMEMNRKSEDIYFHPYIINEEQISAFESSLFNLNKGIFNRCHP